MRTLLRFLVVVALMFWLGGFTFYVSVVVPVGTKVLRSALRQGFITREVTQWLNLAGAIGLTILVVELLASRDPSRWRFRSRLALWGFMAGIQLALFVLHRELNALMQDRGMIVLDSEAFYWRHRVYLWLHTFQWCAGWIFILLTLIGWRVEDRIGAQKNPAVVRVGVAQSPIQSPSGTLLS